ncbi:MAG: undecaprenyl-diphosphate phosphatase [Bryobacteraceae bacterium]
MALSIIQGVTEFLPISSSAHLILIPHLTGWPDQGLPMDVATHIGTLTAVVVYFRRETAELLRSGLRLLAGPLRDPDNLALKIGLATVPVILAGLAFKPLVENEWRSAALIGWMSILFGGLLFLADRRPNSGTALTLRAACLIGLAQALAIIPGVSRSGVAMTAALLLGASRTDSARFSLILSIPVTFAAGTLTTLDLVKASTAPIPLGDLTLAALGAGVTAWLAIAALLHWLSRGSFTPFVLYRVALGAALLAWPAVHR